MKLEFKTARDIYGHRKYICIIPDEKMYSTTCHRMIIDGIEISAGAYKELKAKCEEEKYTQY